MGDIVSLRYYHQDINQEEQAENNNGLSESLFSDDAGEAKIKQSTEQDGQEEMRRLSLRNRILLKKESCLELEKAAVEPDSLGYIQWYKDKEEAEKQYTGLLDEYSKLFSVDDELVELIRNLEHAALFINIDYESINDKSNETNKPDEVPETTNDTGKTDLVPSVETQVISQPLCNQGNYAQAVPNTPIVININNGKVEQSPIELKRSNLLKETVYDAKITIGQVVRTIIRFCIRAILSIYASIFLTLLVNDWFGGILPLSIIKYFKLIPLYSKIADIVKFIVVHARG